MACIDLNCDVGEGAGSDQDLIPCVTSANIACGAHAGDRETMRATAVLAQAHNVGIGAHPGFADRANFGRIDHRLSPEELHALVLTQLEALREFTAFHHVKPHGALYNIAARDAGVAACLASAVCEFDGALILFALAGSELVDAGRRCGLAVAEEGFADRAYRSDGSLTPRSEAGAVHADVSMAVEQAMDMIERGRVRATDGSWVARRVDTICVHGDTPHALELARALRAALRSRGVDVRRFRP